ncbi:MAG TPA: LLM class flavin-dependent oxidoreductase [Pseudonocardia sp.]|jgi:alkanesulfonate monooxygenase SsuD/methylene tetrahydromethanopterin reductase-like flavin-dependent oxidoreductase (luciferase family)
MSRPVYLAGEVAGCGRHPAAWRLPGADPAGLFGAGHWIGLAGLAETAGLDLLVIDDSFAPPPEGHPELVRGRLDAVAVAARVAPLTTTVGLVPVATTTHTEPFHLSKAIATLDFVSLGRAGWQPEVSRTEAEAALFGRKPAAPAGELWREAADAVEVVVRLWDSWEDDAVIRDVATGRYVDRDKLHYVDFAGEFFSVKGPSITPRSPQAHPPVVLRADEPEALPLVGRWADVARVRAADLPAAEAARRRVRDAVAAAGRDPDVVAVLLDVPTLLAPTAAEAAATLERLDSWTPDPDPGGVRSVGTPDALADLVAEVVAGGAADGVTVQPLTLPDGLRAVADGVVPLLVERGLRPAITPAGTLRDRFGLPRPANHFAPPTGATR